MLTRTLAAALALTLATTACQNTGEDTEVAAASEIAWRHGDVDDALAEAKEAGKPVILYWGAVWCPPCNQMKATLFKDPAFIAETENFIPVYLDGDTDGAQRWGEQFGISGYPTVIILQPDGTEVTRIASATMAEDLPELLRVAAGRTTSIEALLAKAETDTANLSDEDWQILGGFDWMNDPKHFSDLAKAGTLLARLAESAPNPALQRRFGVCNDGQVEQAEAGLTPEQQRRVGAILQPMLANPREVKANRQEITYYAPDLVAALPEGAERAQLSEALIAAGDAIFADERLSMTERVDALNIDITRAKADGGVTPAVLAKARERARWADANAKDKVTRQSVIDDAAYILKDAGDLAGGRKLLLAELERSDQPYYYMSSLADFAETEGKNAEAIDWARKAYEASQGPATRVQWAISYSNYVMRLAPTDKAGVERAAEAVLAELGKTQDYYQRTRVKVDAWGKKLADWAASHGGGAVLEDLRAQMAQVCARQGAQAGTCNNWSRA